MQQECQGEKQLISDVILERLYRSVPCSISDNSMTRQPGIICVRETYRISNTMRHEKNVNNFREKPKNVKN